MIAVMSHSSEISGKQNLTYQIETSCLVFFYFWQQAVACCISNTLYFMRMYEPHSLLKLSDTNNGLNNLCFRFIYIDGHGKKMSLISGVTLND